MGPKKGVEVLVVSLFVSLTKCSGIGRWRVGFVALRERAAPRKGVEAACVTLISCSARFD